jgi:type I restriction enzyme R subunit
LGIATNDLNERIAAKLEELEIEDINVAERLEQEMRRDYHLITADRRLDQIADDLVAHYAIAWESGKAMLLCIDKITCVRMYNKIQVRWQAQIERLQKELSLSLDDQESVYLQRQIKWLRETQMAVVISEEQGEVERFRRWELEIEPHRRLLKQGFEMADGTRIGVDQAFKKREHPFRIAIVCAMWLTGFDVPSLATLYLDKPLKAHTLMQAIARANRVDQDKNNGLIVDYCGILKNLRQALATFAGHQGEELIDGVEGGPQVDPTRPAEELLAELAEAIQMVRDFVAAHGAALDDIITHTGFARNAAIVAVKEAANQNDQTRKQFEIMAREVFKKFKACLNDPGINDYRHAYDAVNIVYKSLQSDREKADISAIIRDLHTIVDEAVTVEESAIADGRVPYDISQIDFDRLRQEFAKSAEKNSTVQNLKAAVEQKLERMMQQNPLRTDFQQHYEQIVQAYNREKDRVTIEQTFEQLVQFVQDLDTEAARAMREGLDEETLAFFDLLHKPELSKADIKRVKEVAMELLATLRAEKLKVDNWRGKEATRDAVKIAIKDFLYSDDTGLPKSYSTEEVEEKATAVYGHVFRVYIAARSTVYSHAA